MVIYAVDRSRQFFYFISENELLGFVGLPQSVVLM